MRARSLLALALVSMVAVLGCGESTPSGDAPGSENSKSAVKPPSPDASQAGQTAEHKPGMTPKFHRAGDPPGN